MFLIFKLMAVGGGVAVGAGLLLEVGVGLGVEVVDDDASNKLEEDSGFMRGCSFFSSLFTKEGTLLEED